MRLALETRVKHGVLYELTEKMGGSRAVAEALGIPVKTFWMWLSLRVHPSDKKIEKHWAAIERLCLEHLGRLVEVEDIWPAGLRSVLSARMIPRKVVKYLEPEVLSLSGISDRLLPAVMPEAGENEMAAKMAEVLESLPPKEKRVLVMRFGIEDGRERTLEEIGKSFNVTRERIRRIESSALRKLRHPSRAKKLRPFVDFETWGAV